MSPVKNSNDIKLIRQLIPLATLSEARFSELCEGLSIESGKKGTVLFQQGDTQKEFVYLLKGRVGLLAGGTEMDRVEGGSETARFALAHQIPRKVSAVAQTAVQFVRVDSDIVNARERQQGSSEKSGYHVSDIPEELEGDWMTTMLQSKIFQRLPAANLQKVMISLEEIGLKKGESVIRQGEPGDYYYIIKSGRCGLERQPSPGAKRVKLGELKANDSFGEDALISGEERSVSVKMLTDGSLLRLSKKEFLKLVKEPIVQFFDFKKAEAIVKAGGLFLDVRTPGPFSEKSIVGSQNLPFFSFRVEAGKLDESQRLVIVCDDGKLSEAAAFFLIRFGFDAVVLKGGLAAVPMEALTGGKPSVAIATEVMEPTPAVIEAVEGGTKTEEGEVEALQAEIEKEKAARIKSEQALAIMRCDLQAELKGKDESRLLREKAENALNEKAKKLALLEAAHESLLTQKPKSEKALTELQENFQKSQKNEEERGAEIESLRSQLTLKDKEFDAISMQHETLELESNEYQKVQATLRDELEKRQKEFDEAVNAQELQLKVLQSKFDVEVVEKESLAERYEQEEAVLKSHLAELEEAAKRAESVRADESKGLEEKEVALTERGSELAAMLSERDAELAQLKAENEAAAQEQKEAVKEAEEALSEQSKKAEEKEIALTERGSELETLLSERDDELVQLKKEKETAEQEQSEALSKLGQDLELAQKSSDEAAGEKERQLEEAVKEAKEALSEQSKKAEEKEIALTERGSELETLLSERDDELAQALELAQKSSDEAASEKERQLEEAVRVAEEALSEQSKSAEDKEIALAERSSELEALLSERDDELAGLRKELEASEQLQKEQLEASEERLSLERQEKESAVLALDSGESEISQQLTVVRLELDEVNQKAKETVESYEQKLEKIETARSELMQRVSDGRSERVSMQAERDELESAQSALKADLESVQLALKVAEQSVEQGEKNKLLVAEERAEVEQKLIDSEAAVVALKAQSEGDQAHLVEENSRLAEELKALSEKCDLMHEEQQRLEEAVSEGGVSLKNAQDEIQKQNDEQAALVEASGSELREERKNLQEQLEAVKVELQDKDQALSRQLDEIEAREAELVEQLKEAALSVDSKEEEIVFNESVYSEKLTEFDEERAQLKDEMVSLRAGSDELSSRLEEKSRALTAQEEKSFSLRKEVAVLERRMQDAVDGKGEAELWPDDHEALDQARVDKKELLDEKALLAGQIDSLVEQNEELKQVVQEFVEASGEGQEKEEGLDSLMAELEMVREQAASDVKAINEQLQQAKEQAVGLEKELKAAEEKIKEVDQRPSLLEGVEVADNDVFSMYEEPQAPSVSLVQPSAVNNLSQGGNKGVWIVVTVLLLSLIGAAGFFTDQGQALLGLSQPMAEDPQVEEVLDHVVEAIDEKESALPVKQKKQSGEPLGSLLETMSSSHDSAENEVEEVVKPVAEDEELLVEDGEELLIEESEDELF